MSERDSEGRVPTPRHLCISFKNLFDCHILNSPSCQPLGCCHSTCSFFQSLGGFCASLEEQLIHTNTVLLGSLAGRPEAIVVLGLPVCVESETQEEPKFWRGQGGIAEKKTPGEFTARPQRGNQSPGAGGLWWSQGD